MSKAMLLENLPETAVLRKGLVWAKCASELLHSKYLKYHILYIMLL
jgi:hypothetical protein